LRRGTTATHKEWSSLILKGWGAENNVDIIMRKVAIGLAALTIATAGSTLTASALPGGVLSVPHNPLVMTTTLTRCFGVVGLSSTVDSVPDSAVGSWSAVGSGAYMDSVPDSAVDSWSAEGGGRGYRPPRRASQTEGAPTGAFRIEVMCVSPWVA
jgi:hypothetical protein